MVFRRSLSASWTLIFSLALLVLVVTGCDGGAQAPAVTPTSTTETTPDTTQPTETTGAATDEAPTPVAAGTETDLFEVISPTTYLAANGELHVAGIIKYKGSSVRVRPVVTVSLKDEAGGELASMDANDVPPIIKPGSPIPYNRRFTSPPAKWARLDVKTTADEASEMDLLFHYADFETAQAGIEVPSAQDSMKPVKVTGTVKNTGSKSADGVSVSVVLYYADGRVADVVSTGTTSGKLAPGESSEFEAESIFATFEKQPIAKIEAVAYGRVDDE